MRDVAGSSVYTGNFEDTVLDAQSVFAAAMQAMARPGTQHAIHASAAPPAPLNRVSAALALTLFDADTLIYIDPSLRNDRVDAWIRFHTDAPITQEKLKAHFALMADLEAVKGFECFALGTQDYPDRSTTLIVHVQGFEAHTSWALQGPGVDGVASLAPTNATSEIADVWARNNALFPRGIDVILAGPDCLVGLPRTTRLSVPSEV